MRARTAVVVAMLAGCSTPPYAIVHGKRVQRPSFGYTDGDLFAVQHERAYPGLLDGDRPFHVDDGMLRGRACGLDLQFSSEWYGHKMTLNGRGMAPPPWIPSDDGISLTVAIDDDGAGHRHINGGPVDIDVSPERLVATIGTRTVDLYAQGHWLVGRLSQHAGASVIEAPFVVYGREMLRTMVPADEALILIWMITCNGAIEYGGRPERGFSLVAAGFQSTPAAPLGPTEVVRGASGIHDAPPTPVGPTPWANPTLSNSGPGGGGRR